MNRVSTGRFYVGGDPNPRNTLYLHFDLIVHPMLQKNIAVLTGTRAEYGLLRPVMDAILAHPALALQLVVTGMHLDPAFGSSVEEIERDGYHIAARVPMSPPEDSGKGMALAVAAGIQGLTEAFDALRPDVLVLLGDRTEVLAGATAALFLGIPIAHIHGGDVTRGGTDESVRHAVTKVAHIHFPATAASATRILGMGEDEWRIHLTGAPCLDTILRHQPLDRTALNERYGLPVEGPFVLLVQHAVSTEPEEAEAQITATLDALDDLGWPVLALYPNSDAGGRRIIAALEARRYKPGFYLQQNLSQSDYFSLLRHCALLIGNSSSGMIESSSFHIPVINIGIRQEGRERGANVIDAPHEAEAIRAAITQALSPAFQATLPGLVNPYGGGDTGTRIATALASVELGKELIQKKLNSR